MSDYNDYDHLDFSLPKMARRVFVNVLALHKTDGSLEIKEIIMDDGRRFKVNKTIAKGYAMAPLTRSSGKKYEIRIGSQYRDIYLMKDLWFVEVQN